MVSAIVGAVIGIIATLLGVWATYLLEKRSQENFAAAILYNDLKSIEKYLACERSSVNLRYSDNWQQIVANCSFLKDKELETIYAIYGDVYNYDYGLIEKTDGFFKKEDIASYRKLQNEMFDTSKGYPDFKNNAERYKEVKKVLQEHVK